MFKDFLEPLKADYSDKSHSLSKTNKKERLEFLIFVLLGGILPVVLIILGIIPYAYRMYVIFSIGILMILIEKWRNISWTELGFRRDTLKSSFMANGFLVIAVGSLLIYLDILGLIPESGMPIQTPLFYVFYVILLGPIQELIFRSIVFAEFKRSGITNIWIKVLLSALIFVLPHLIYGHATITIVALVIGLIWGWIYNRYPNWLGVAMSHSIMGAIAIYIGLI